MWGSGAFNSVLVSNSREPAQKGLSKNKSLPAEVQFHQKTRLQQGPVLKAMLSPLPPPTQQQMNCLCSGLLVVTYRRSHGKGVTVSLCWINISSWTLVWLFDPLLWKQRSPSRSWWQGAKLYPWGCTPIQACTSGATAGPVLQEHLSWPAWPAPGPPIPVGKAHKVWRILSSPWGSGRFLPARTALASDKWKSSLISSGLCY